MQQPFGMYVKDEQQGFCRWNAGSMCFGCSGYEVEGFSTMKCWRDGEDALHGLWMRFGVEDPRFCKPYNQSFEDIEDGDMENPLSAARSCLIALSEK